MDNITLVALEHEHLFPNGSSNLDILLSNIPLYHSLKFIVSLGGNIPLPRNPFNNQSEYKCIIDFARHTGDERITNTINVLYEKIGWKVLIFRDNRVVCALIEKLLQYGDARNYSHLNDSNYRLLFEAYINIFSEEYKYRFVQELPNSGDEYSDAMLVTKNRYQEYEIFEFCKYFSIEKSKSESLLNHLKNNAREYYERFLSFANLHDSENAINDYINLIETVYEKKTIESKNITESQVDFLKKISINLAPNIEYKDDFIALRTYPLFYNESDDSFMVLSLQFLMDKLYQSLLFHLKNDGVKGYRDLKVKLGESFFERELFYKKINEFTSYSDVALSGAELHCELKQGESYYYIRRGNKIYLFEVKDYSITSDIILSQDAEKSKEFYKNKLTCKEGISQIYKNIKLIKSGGYDSIDNGVSVIDAIFYPIIIVGDFHYITDGINYELNKELLKLNNGVYQCAKLIMIHIDAFFKYETLFKSSEFSFFDALDKYSDSITIDFKSFNSFVEFSDEYTKYKNDKLNRVYQYDIDY